MADLILFPGNNNRPPGANAAMLAAAGIDMQALDEPAIATIALLEDALRQARTGKYIAAGFVLVARPDDKLVDTNRSWITHPGAPPTRLVAGLTMLIADIADGQGTMPNE